MCLEAQVCLLVCTYSVLVQNQHECFKESFNEKAVPDSAGVTEPLEFSLLIQLTFVLFGVYKQQ